MNATELVDFIEEQVEEVAALVGDDIDNETVVQALTVVNQQLSRLLAALDAGMLL